ncbi:MAG TPA: FHA domain-containing protein, partial [Planctomycetota bacterium]|nr:FHA domain-containing protein [Planctomycetota bacterium]
MPKLIIQLMNEEWTVELQVGSNVLGRASTCGVPLKDPSLSRQHCDIVFVGGHATVVDKGSLNGTLVNGRKVSEHALQPGDKIVIGASTIWYEKKNVAVEK